MFMDEVEQGLQTSGRTITDPKLNRYVHEIICRLAPAYCADLRVYIVETPHFNASMAPNGFMQVWTGLMLRAQNEAQLAYVLGHEIGHYQKRHTIQQWRVVRNTSSALSFFQLAAAAAGQGYAGDIAQLIALAGIMAYSRDMERESDDIGIGIMAEAGYDPREAPRIWKALEVERKAAEDPDAFIFFSTHPSTKDRIHTMEVTAEQLIRERGQGERHQDRYIAATRNFRAVWLREEIRKRDFSASEVVLDHLADRGDRPEEVHYFRGELFRLRGNEGDLEKALECYTEAASFDDVPPVVYRDMGLVHWKLGHDMQAREYLEAYIEKSPQASDQEMIRAYLLELE
jgi:tetratricopeptide (TPR) repeat protein